ncbi:hypothetical protein ES708_23690 [subsurface metagenome]
MCSDIDYKVGEALSDWLQTQSWQYFFTVTCRKPRVDSLALMRDISEVDGYSKLFIACEPHRLNRNLHAHGLLATPEPSTLPWRGEHYRPSQPIDFWDKWFHRFGRTRVEPIRSMADVAGYCADYVCKITDGDNYDFYGGELDWI